jgi:hypothetical protein
MVLIFNFGVPPGSTIPVRGTVGDIGTVVDGAALVVIPILAKEIPRAAMIRTFT